MRQAAVRWWRTGWSGDVGRSLSLLAVLCQLLAAVLLPIPGANAAPGTLAATAGVICHAGDGTGPAQDHAPVHHPVECALCPICLVVALPALVSPPPALPALVARLLDATLPPALAGPVAGVRRLAAQPRGPPAPV